MSGHTYIHTHTYTHTYTHDNYSNPRCAHAHRGLINEIVFRVAVNTYVPIFRGLDARGGRKLRTDTRDNLSI